MPVKIACQHMKIHENLKKHANSLYGKPFSNIFPWLFTKNRIFYFFFHSRIMAIKWTEDCSWALPRPYTDKNCLFSACEGMQESSWNFTKSASSLEKITATPSPLLWVRQTYQQYVMAGNSERYVLGATDITT